jgi:hypothetical protein
MAICVSRETAASMPAPEETARVMRWMFRRGSETVICELGLNRDDSAYELRITPASNPIGLATELFDDAMSAFERNTAIERKLIADGWSLESFESERVER